VQGACCVKLRGQVYGRPADGLEGWRPLGNIRGLTIKPQYLRSTLSARSRARGCGDTVVARMDISFDALTWSADVARLLNSTVVSSEPGGAVVEAVIQFATAGTLYALPPALIPAALSGTLNASICAVPPFDQPPCALTPLPRSVFTIHGGFISFNDPGTYVLQGIAAPSLCFASVNASSCATQLRIDGENCHDGSHWIVDIWRADVLPEQDTFLTDETMTTPITGRIARDNARSDFPYYRITRL
jgi:hypothetical protein